MAGLITVDTFETRTGRTLTAQQAAQVSALITDASALVVDIVNNTVVTSVWTAPEAVPASLVPVVVSMVRRGLDNPGGYESETIGSYRYSGASQAGIFATRQEVKAIRRAVGSDSVTAMNLEAGWPGRTSWSWLDGAL